MRWNLAVLLRERACRLGRAPVLGGWLGISYDPELQPTIPRPAVDTEARRVFLASIASDLLTLEWNQAEPTKRWTRRREVVGTVVSESLSVLQSSAMAASWRGLPILWNSSVKVLASARVPRREPPISRGTGQSFRRLPCIAVFRTKVPFLPRLLPASLRHSRATLKRGKPP